MAYFRCSLKAKVHNIFMHFIQVLVMTVYAHRFMPYVSHMHPPRSTYTHNGADYFLLLACQSNFTLIINHLMIMTIVFSTVDFCLYSLDESEMLKWNDTKIFNCNGNYENYLLLWYTGILSRPQIDETEKNTQLITIWSIIRFIYHKPIWIYWIALECYHIRSLKRWITKNAFQWTQTEILWFYLNDSEKMVFWKIIWCQIHYLSHMIMTTLKYSMHFEWAKLSNFLGLTFSTFFRFLLCRSLLCR